MSSITVTFDPPVPSDNTATFNNKAFATLGALNTWSSQANTVASEVSTNATTASNAASTATTQAGIATSAASTATTQAGNASTSASNASASASAASTSATNASNSAAAAAASAASVNLSSIAITGGTINGASIGATTKSTGAFTTLSATGTIQSGSGSGTSTGWVQGYYGSSGVAGMWTTAVTPSTTNFSFAASSTATLVNGASDVFIRVANSDIARATSTGLAVTGALSATGLLSTSVTGTSIGAKVQTNQSGAYMSFLDNGGLDGYVRVGSSNNDLILMSGNSVNATLNSSGNLGLGTTPSAWTNGKALQVSSYSAFGQRTAGTSEAFMSWNAYITSGTNPATGYVYRNTGDVASLYDQSGAHRWYSAPSGTAGNAITWTQNMMLDFSGNLGISVTPATWYSAAGTSAKTLQGDSWGIASNTGTDTTSFATNARQTAYGSGDSSNWVYRVAAPAANYVQVSGQHQWLTSSSGSAGAAISWTKAMFLDVAGNLYLGTTSSSGLSKMLTINDPTGGSAGIVYKVSNSTIGYSYANPGSVTIETSTGNVINCISSTAGVRLTNGATSWAAISDETQKDIIEPVTNALASVISWRKVIGKYKADIEGTRRQFLIAQDVQKTTPEAIDTDTDGVLSLRYTDTIPTLAAAIEELAIHSQQQRTQIESLLADKAALMPVLASVDDRLYALEAR